MSNGSLSGAVYRNVVLCEGWLEYKNDKHARYEKIWMNLRKGVLSVFSTNNTSPESQIGSLKIDSSTKFHSRSGGSAKKGYKFDLLTGQRINRFKCCKNSERELWRGYITGMAMGKVPDNLDLLDSVIQHIIEDISGPKVIEDTVEDLSKAPVHRFPKRDSGVSSMLDGESSLSHGSSQSIFGGGGPTMVHKFYINRPLEESPPSWFLSPCSREYAELVLTKAAQFRYGNSLMRTSTSQISNGSYVISKGVWNQRENSFVFEHFEVIRTVGGYKINVQNAHNPLKCLTDVMDYFVETAGGQTKPLVTNDLVALGLDVPDYAREISGTNKAMNESQPDYEKPASLDPPATPSTTQDILHKPSFGVHLKKTAPVTRKSQSVIDTLPVAPHPPHSAVQSNSPSEAVKPTIKSDSELHNYCNIKSIVGNNSMLKAPASPKCITFTLDTDDVPSVDNNTPGGVNTIKFKFEQRIHSSNFDKPPGNNARIKQTLENIFSAEALSKSVPNSKHPLAQAPEEQDHVYEPLPDNQIELDRVAYYNVN